MKLTIIFIFLNNTKVVKGALMEIFFIEHKPEEP